MKLGLERLNNLHLLLLNGPTGTGIWIYLLSKSMILITVEDKAIVTWLLFKKFRFTESQLDFTSIYVLWISYSFVANYHKYSGSKQSF